MLFRSNVGLDLYLDAANHTTSSFLFLYFHSDTKLSTSRARIVNIFSGSIDRMLRNDTKFRLVAVLGLFGKVLLNNTMLQIRFTNFKSDLDSLASGSAAQALRYKVGDMTSLMGNVSQVIDDCFGDG